MQLRMTKEESRARDDVIWEMRARGMTTVEIARELKIAQPSVSRSIKRSNARYIKRYSGSLEAGRRVREAQLDGLLSQAIAAWRSSCDENEGLGNLDYLHAARAVMSDIRKLTGLDMPTKLALTNPDGSQSANCIPALAGATRLLDEVQGLLDARRGGNGSPAGAGIEARSIVIDPATVVDAIPRPPDPGDAQSSG